MMLTTMLIGIAVAAQPERSPAWDLVRRQPTPVVIAHRGASNLAPENTIAAVKKAVSVGAMAIEFDVRRTSDKKLILMHDTTLARTTNGRGRVRSTSWSYISGLSAGGWFNTSFQDEGVPLFADALKALGPDAVAAVELKTAEPLLIDLRTAISEQGATGRIVIFSFKVKQIVDTRRLLPNTPALLLVDPDRFSGAYSDQLIASSISVAPDAIGLNESGVTEAIVKRFHTANIPVFVYTVDDPRRVEQMVQMGVDGIISNRPRATQTHVALLAQSSKDRNRKDKQGTRGNR